MLQLHLPFAEFLLSKPFTGPAQPGRDAGALLLIAFLFTFAFIRTSARLNHMQVSWWPGSIKTSSGLHLHHLVWGISAMIIFSFLAVVVPPAAPWWQICVAGIGVGAGLTLDEFALWVRLQDVYWSAEGRSSIDAVLMAALFMGLIVVGISPFGIEDKASSGLAMIAIVQAIILSFSCFFKGRIFYGMVAIFIPLFGLIGALRLARPDSPWARRFYVGKRLHKHERAIHRYRVDGLGARFHNAFFNAIGGRADP